MTKEEFNKIGFTANMKAMYRGKEHPIISFDSIESLIGIGVEHDEDITWVRCENVEIVK